MESAIAQQQMMDKVKGALGMLPVEQRQVVRIGLL